MPPLNLIPTVIIGWVFNWHGFRESGKFLRSVLPLCFMDNALVRIIQALMQKVKEKAVMVNLISALVPFSFHSLLKRSAVIKVLTYLNTYR